MPEEVESGQPDFKPGWPDIFPHGLIVARSIATSREVDSAAEDEADEDEQTLRWVMMVGTSNEDPRLALLGDLAIRTKGAFAGVTVIMPISVRTEPKELDDEFNDGLLRQYGEWASSLMYDHAAASMRAMMSGNGLNLEVPYETPEVSLHTSDHFDDEDAGPDESGD